MNGRKFKSQLRKAMTPKAIDRLDQILAPIQAEYDGGDPMLPGTIPQVRAALLQWRDEAVVTELKQMMFSLRTVNSEETAEQWAGRVGKYLEARIKQLEAK